MKPKRAAEFPLVREFDFSSKLGVDGGEGTLLVPQKDKDLYLPRNYGYGELALAQYIQVPFNKNNSIRLERLIKVEFFYFI